MEFLTKITDVNIETEYSLYKFSLSELRERIKQNLGNISEMQLRTFASTEDLNSRYLYESLYNIYAFKNGLRNEENYNRNLESLKETLEDIRETNQNYMPSFIRKEEKALSKIKFNLGLQSSFFVVSVDNINDLDNAKYTLLDGFYRLLYSKEESNAEILVKVYNNLNDESALNLLLSLNSWKFAENSHVTFNNPNNSYLDRGFRLFLYVKYNIDFVKMPSRIGDMFNLLNCYAGTKDSNSLYYYTTPRTIFFTLYNNPSFHKDILTMYSISNYFPENSDLNFFSLYIQYEFNSPYKFFLYQFISYMGKIRCGELENVNKNLDISLSDLINIMNDKRFLKLSEKYLKMSVPARIAKYFELHIKCIFIDYFTNKSSQIAN